MQQSLINLRQNPFSFFGQSLKKYIEEGRILEKRGCLELEVEFLAEEEEINSYLESWLKSLCPGKFRHIEITGVSLKIDSFYSHGKRYVPGPTTLLIDYDIYKLNKNLAAKTWKIERFLYERNELYPEGSPHKNQGNAKDIWLDWMEMISRVNNSETCVFSNYCSIEGLTEIFLAFAICGAEEIQTVNNQVIPQISTQLIREISRQKIPHNCPKCIYFYGQKYQGDFVVCGFHHQGKLNCKKFACWTSELLATLKKEKKHKLVV